MIHSSSVVLSQIDGEKVDIAPFVYIGKNVILGKGVTIHPHVVIDDGVTIDDGVEVYPGAYIGKPPKGPALGSHTEYKKELHIGKGCVIGSNVTLYYGDRVGAFTLISDGVSIRENVMIGDHCIIGRNATINYSVTIEDHVKIMDLAHITAHSYLQQSAFVGPGVCTADDNGFGKGGHTDPSNVGGATVRKNASIGAGAVLLPKVVIGENAVVGAGAVVTRDVGRDERVMGIPARSRDK